MNGILLWTVLFLISTVNAQDAPEKVTLQLPGGVEMNFRAVYLGVDGNALFASKRIKLGSREQEGANYKEQLTDTLISGGFVGSRGGKKEWLYYLGETEVRQDQWDAVMSPSASGNAGQSSGKKRLPKTAVSIAEIYSFIEALNTWMLSHQQKNLPRYRNAVAFCRLPTETEWEFAARGGIAVSPDVFDRRHPYTDDNGNEFIGNHEWYRNTSGRRVRPCGSPHIKANPIGLFDMLGNVEEITLSLFGPEYQQGRFGQFVIRGGNFSTDESNISSCSRTEYQSHQEKEGKLLRQSKVGFRLALGTRITSSGLLPDELDEGFKKYISSRGLTQPGPSGKSSPSSQAGQDMQHSRKELLARLHAENERLSQKLDTLEAAKNEVQKELFLAKSDKENLERKLSSARKELEEMGRQKSRQPKQDNNNFQKALVKRLRSRIGILEQQVRKSQSIGFVENKMEETLARKNQEIKDLKRRVAQCNHETGKNAGRVRYTEKRLIEALMRQASANAYLGYQALKELDLLIRNKMRPKNKKAVKLREGTQMVHDYYKLVVQIADETQADLFPEVKAEFADWLREKEKEGFNEFQRKALDMMERHVSDARKRRYHRPEDLVRSFLNEPEFK